MPQSENNGDITKFRFIHHFLPHKQYRKRAKLLSHGAFFMYSLSLLLLIGVFKVLPMLLPGVLGYASNIETSSLLKYTNERRASVGLSPLQMNDSLSNAANKKAKHMFKEGYWAHVSPSGVKPWDFILGEGYDYVYAGENLAKNFQNSKDVVEAWYNSPSHRDNLLSSNYTEIGFAIVNGELEGYETTIVVQMFGKTRVPAALAVNPPIVKQEEVPAEVVPEVVPEIEEPVLTPVLEPVFIQQVQSDSTSQEKFIDVRNISTTLVLIFGGFIFSLLSLDIWYSKKHGILKLTGHTLAHLVFLLVALFSILFTVFPGDIL